MIRGIYLDAASGIAGDMFLASLIDLGLDLEALTGALEGLGLDSYRLATRTVHRGAIRATKFDVVVQTASGEERMEGLGDPHSAHAEGAGHHHGHGSHEHGKSYREIQELIRESRLSSRAKEHALAIFQHLGTAEARVHGTTLEDVHFHEVGAVDSIVDICGAAVSLDLLRIDEVACSTVGVGEGTRRMAHGTLPIPVPATAELLVGMPIRRTGVQGELVTPTGAAILKALVHEFRPSWECKTLSLGYGAGNTDRADPPNVLRSTLYEREVQDSSRGLEAAPDGFDEVWELEVQVDDMTGEALGFLRQRLEEAGALDVAMSALQMKKNRPGHRIVVLSSLERREELEDLMLLESSTLGLRRRLCERRLLARSVIEIATPWGIARAKVARRGNKVMRIAPEFDDAALLARSANKPLVDVMRAIEELGWKKMSGE